jgi:pyruvate-formate lyase-activating enzyme
MSGDGKHGRSVPLSIDRHDRDNMGMHYVYAVRSRRAGGISVGVNLNANSACNWACIYCQVPGLVRGGPDPVDLVRLEDELQRVLRPDGQHTALANEEAGIVDVAFSGNGEPTEAPEFADAVSVVARQIDRAGLAVPIRLISNGSLVRRAAVQAGIGRLAAAGGEVWFKIDRAGSEASRRVNGAARSAERTFEDACRCAVLAPTWIQTCWFATADGSPSAGETAEYLALLERLRGRVRGVHLYGLARPSMQPGADSLRRLSRAELDLLGSRIAELGMPVTVNP